ncbi:YopX family protein [Bacillus mycoides]|uniref:YopX family protein n=1 Tax=Bacillus mycoides TaxID=1405 RepID=UPI003D649CFE
MREIKFRVYDPNSNEIIATNVGIDKIHLYDFSGDNITEQDGLVITQYTGLKDKNGKDIYEGDILECTSELLTNFGTTRTGRYETTYKQVIWLTDSWGYRVLKSKHIVEGAERKGLEVAIKFGVVCGNIYENPELLEESK